MATTLAEPALLISDGKRVASARGKMYATLNPATGQALAEMAEARLEDGERAVAAASFEYYG